LEQEPLLPFRAIVSAHMLDRFIFYDAPNVMKLPLFIRKHRKLHEDGLWFHINVFFKGECACKIFSGQILDDIP